MKEYSIERQAPWLVGLPESWEIRKVKYFFNVVNGSTPKSSESTYWGGDITWITPADYKTEDKYICSSRKAITQEGLDSCGTSKVPAGSIIVSNRAPIGSIGIAEKELCTSQGCKSLVKIAEINEEYIYYYLSVMSGPLNMLGRGTTFMELSSNDLANFRLPIPTLKDQNAIVQILNKKIVAINDVINKKAKVIELLEEQRISIICSAVTKGIDSTAEMKDSGVEWLGEIPAHWNVLTNHQLFAERNIKCAEQDAVLLSVTKYLGVILQSQAEELNLATVAPAETTEGYKVVHKGDLVMNIMRAKDGSYGISGYDGVISPAYCIYYPRQKVNPQYLYYLFKTPMYMEIFKNYSTGIAEHRMRLYPVNFFKIPAVVPPLEEQNEIVTYLDKRVKDIDELISLTQQQIEKLKEYRQSVISEVVTGKVAVE